MRERAFIRRFENGGKWSGCCAATLRGCFCHFHCHCQLWVWVWFSQTENKDSRPRVFATPENRTLVFPRMTLKHMANRTK